MPENPTRRAMALAYPGADPGAPPAQWYKLKGEWVLLVSPVWNMQPGHEVSVRRRDGRRHRMTLGEFIGNTGPKGPDWRAGKDAFRPVKVYSLGTEPKPTRNG